MSRVYDNWERLVGAVLKREELRDIARCSSLTSSDFSFHSDRTGLTTPFTPLPSGPVGNNAATRGIATGAALLFARAFALYRRKKPRDPAEEFHVGQLKRFSLHELQAASDNFSNKNILGRGGFGKVYKGRLADGSLVAVKRQRERTRGGELQFRAQMEIPSMAVHPNLLQLLGFCITPTERLLVYPYMANGSVASCLRDRSESQPPLDWPIRKRIALGSARGLAFLHDNCDPKIIHRDVKAANVLLDEDFEAVLGDFGVAVLMDCVDTHVNTEVHGTIGYIAPEYLSTGKLSEKTDVFSYGVMLLEFITGQRAYDLARLANDDDVMLLDWVKGQLSKINLETLVDADLRGNYIDEEVEQLIQIALLCTRSSPAERPKMSEVVMMLEGDGLVERWEEWEIQEMFRHKFNHLPRRNIDWIMTAEEEQEVHLRQLKIFSLHELQVASDNFSNKNILGRGGFGKVYKGQLADGSLVAVKRLKKQTQGGKLQFQTQVELASMAVHRNLIQLLGICITQTERLLVYPYMTNGSVASYLRDRPESQSPLDWPIRKRIALGSARGLTYLHDSCDPNIIHRDIKAANILLDKDFEAVVGDFGLAKFMFPKDTHVSTAIHGTFGHMAPEYLSTGKISEKIDVYGYGVMLLEFITGQRVSHLARLANDDDVMLLDWVEGLLSENKLEMLVDADLQGNYINEEVEQLIQVALLCTQSSPTQRPQMFEVVKMIEGDGLAERWEECKKQEMFIQEFNHMPRPNIDWIMAAEEEQEDYLGQLKIFSLHELQVASDNFSNKNILGRGGFGKVYKGRLADGSLVAVKRLEDRTQDRELQFQTQVEMASMIVHRNLLQLLGFCITQTERLLVYPYMANGSVASCLKERSESQLPLDWPIRKKIALGSARGLAYLHDNCDPKIIHRDVKAANILLDEDFEAVVGDFGLAKLMDCNDNHVATAIHGTFGHIAPEYLSTGKISEKIDVYGYGVMLLEFITGQRAFDLVRLAKDDDVMFLDWVEGLLSEKKLEMLVDADLTGNYIDKEVEQLIQVALICTQSSPTQRPKMSEVVMMLEGDRLAERWEECQKEEMFRQEVNHMPHPNTDWINPDSTSNIHPDELSGPR